MGGGQGAGIGGGDAGQDLLFAEGLEHGAVPAGLAPADLEAQAGPAVEQGDDLVVQGVDALAQFEQGFLEGARSGGIVRRGRAHANLP